MIKKINDIRNIKFERRNEKMALKRFTNGDKLKVDQINYDENTSILDAIFPIGRGFIDFTNTDYSNYLGFTWERELIGFTPVGYKAGDTDFGTIGKTGGERTHKLTIDEMPSHNHRALNARWMNYGLAGNGNMWGFSADDNTSPQMLIAQGGSQSHNNLQPYEVVAYWKRIA